MSLFKYFTKTSTSVSISEGDVSQDNEGSSRSHDGESFAAEAVATPTRNMKRKSQARSIAKRRRWNEVYVNTVPIVQQKRNTISIHPLIVCFVQSSIAIRVLFLRNSSYILKNNILNISISPRSFMNHSYLLFANRKDRSNCK